MRRRPGSARPDGGHGRDRDEIHGAPACRIPRPRKSCPFDARPSVRKGRIVCRAIAGRCARQCGGTFPYLDWGCSPTDSDRPPRHVADDPARSTRARFREDTMTAIEMRPDGIRATRPAIRKGSALQQLLLGCGILSSLMYLVADVLGGLRYEGYSFSSQAISELMAVGAPSEAVVDPLFIAYDVLT